MTKSYLLLISILFMGCDPAKVLIIKTSGKPDAYVTVYANNSILPRTQENFKESLTEKIIIHFPSSDYPSKNDTTFYYGFGGWQSELIQTFTSNIDSIIINKSSGKLVLTNKDDINKYLLKKRSGFAKRKLTIEAN